MTALLTRLLGRLPIGWLQLRHHRGRLLAAMAGIAFADLLVFVQLGFLGAMLGSIGLPYRALDADVLIQSADANTLQDGSPLPRARMMEALTVPGVASASALYLARFDWKQPDGTIRALDVLGIDPREAALRLPEVNAQRDMLMLSGAALIDRGTRNVPPALFAEIDAGQVYRVEGNARRFELLGTFRIGGGFGADGFLVVSDQTFLKLFRTRSPAAPSVIMVRAEAGQDPRALATRINAALSEDDAVARTVDDAIRRDQRFQTTQKPVGIVFGFGVLVGALVGIAITYQVLSTDVNDHMKEYATFKAVGYRHGFFVSIIAEQSVILGLLGFVPGMLVAFGFYALVSAITGLPLAMDAARLLGVLTGTIVMCLLSGMMAARRLKRAEPAALF